VLSATPAAIANTVFDALELLGVDPVLITREATLAELHVDSLDLAELAHVVEERFLVVFTPADYASMRTVGDILGIAEARALRQVAA
jgi:acyl carrier protein